MQLAASTTVSPGVSVKSSWPTGGAAGSALIHYLGLQSSLWGPVGGSRDIKYEEEQQQRQAADEPYELCLLFALPVRRVTVLLK